LQENGLTVGALWKELISDKLFQKQLEQTTDHQLINLVVNKVRQRCAEQTTERELAACMDRLKKKFSRHN